MLADSIQEDMKELDTLSIERVEDEDLSNDLQETSQYLSTDTDHIQEVIHDTVQRDVNEENESKIFSTEYLQDNVMLNLTDINQGPDAKILDGISQPLHADMFYEIAKFIHDLKDLSTYSQLCHDTHSAAQPLLDPHRIFYLKTPVEDVPQLIRDLSHRIKTSTALQLFATQITVQNAVRLFDRLLSHIYDSDVLIFYCDDGALDLYSNSGHVWTFSGTLVVELVTLLIHNVNQSLFTTVASVLMSPHRFLPGLPELNLHATPLNIPNNIIDLINATNNFPAQDSEFLTETRDRYPPPFNGIFPQNCSRATMLLNNTAAIEDLCYESVVVALLRVGNRFNAFEFLTKVPISAAFIPSFVPLLYFHSNRDMEVLCDHSLDEWPDVVAAILDTPEYQDLVYENLDHFHQHVVGYLLRNNNIRIMEVIVQNYLITEVINDIVDDHTLMDHALINGQVEMVRLLLSVPNIDLYKKGENSWSLCAFHRLLSAYCTPSDFRAQIISLDEFRDRIVSNPTAFRDFLESKPNHILNILLCLSESPFFDEILLQCGINLQWFQSLPGRFHDIPDFHNIGEILLKSSNGSNSTNNLD